jgi:hypothetical protein
MIQKERLNLNFKYFDYKKSSQFKRHCRIDWFIPRYSRRDIIQLTDNNLAERNYGGISLPNSFKRLDSYLDRSDDSLKLNVN